MFVSWKNVYSRKSRRFLQQFRNAVKANLLRDFVYSVHGKLETVGGCFEPIVLAQWRQIGPTRFDTCFIVHVGTVFRNGTSIEWSLWKIVNVIIIRCQRIDLRVVDGSQGRINQKSSRSKLWSSEQYFSLCLSTMKSFFKFLYLPERLPKIYRSPP